MDRIILLPFVGSLGTIAGVAWFYSSNSRSQVAGNPSPSHIWKVQPIDSVEIPYRCGKDWNNWSFDSGVFKVKVNEGEIEKNGKDLMGKKEVKVKVGFEFKVEKDWEQVSKLKSDGKAYMIVYGWNGGRLVITVGKDINDAWKNFNSGLKCKIDSDKGYRSMAQNMKGWESLYLGEISLGEGNETVSLKGWSGVLTASELSCKVKDGSTTACDIKLAHAADRTWNTVVSEKLKLLPQAS